jgi:DNA processing protein
MNPTNNQIVSPPNQEDALYAIAFSMLPGIGTLNKNKLLKYYKSAKNIYQYKNSRQAEWPLNAAENELKFIKKNGIQCFTNFSQNYPNRLTQIPDAPTVLYLNGSNAFNLPQLISIVGTRQATFQVNKVITELIEGLSHLKMGVISGMALGVDGIAHETALKNKLPTWGVLAHGLDQMYPYQHRKLATEMLATGGLITECGEKTITMPFQFPKRNRIVAGMSDATIVIESDLSGGSMITAKLASGYDREVFAVPGKIHDIKSKGCLWLVKNHIAQLYHDPVHLLENMNWPIASIDHHSNTEIKEQAMIKLKAPENAVYQLIQTQGPLHLDSLSDLMNLEKGELAVYLLSLEIHGLIHLQAGNRYCCS